MSKQLQILIHSNQVNFWILILTKMTEKVTSNQYNVFNGGNRKQVSVKCLRAKCNQSVVLLYQLYLCPTHIEADFHVSSIIIVARI